MLGNEQIELLYIHEHYADFGGYVLRCVNVEEGFAFEKTVASAFNRQPWTIKKVTQMETPYVYRVTFGEQDFDRSVLVDFNKHDIIDE